MVEALVFTNLTSPKKEKKDPHIWRILYRGDLDRFIEACTDTDRRLADYIINT